MRPQDLLLRCYAYKGSDGQWYAICLDLCLAAQGARFSEVRTKLHHQIAEYVYDATVGPDQEHAAELLSRKAPLSQWMHYYWLKASFWLAHSRLKLKDGMGKLFTETLPLKPAC